MGLKISIIWIIISQIYLKYRVSRTQKIKQRASFSYKCDTQFKILLPNVIIFMMSKLMKTKLQLCNIYFKHFSINCPFIYFLFLLKLCLPKLYVMNLRISDNFKHYLYKCLIKNIVYLFINMFSNQLLAILSPLRV